MSKILNQIKADSSKKEFINREDYEYTLKNTFTNATIVVAAVSIYATFAFITIQYLRK
jgi:hypothetical protein